jgi:hypothetical protein
MELYLVVISNMAVVALIIIQEVKYEGIFHQKMLVYGISVSLCTICKY